MRIRDGLPSSGRSWRSWTKKSWRAPVRRDPTRRVHGVNPPVARNRRPPRPEEGYVPPSSLALLSLYRRRCRRRLRRRRRRRRYHRRGRGPHSHRRRRRRRRRGWRRPGSKPTRCLAALVAPPPPPTQALSPPTGGLKKLRLLELNFTQVADASCAALAAAFHSGALPSLEALELLYIPASAAAITNLRARVPKPILSICAVNYESDDSDGSGEE